MSEPTYSISLTEPERTALAKVLGGLVTKLINAPVQINGNTSTPSPVPSTTPPAAAQSPAPIAVRDRWARDRKGKEVASPEGSWPADVHLWKTKQAGKFLAVTWQTETAGHADANCFDSELWPWLIKQCGQKTRIYLKKNGNYLNIVGVKA